MVGANERLSQKKRLFCREFIVDLCGKRAAIRAGYSEKTAESQASRLLSTVKVQVEIQKMMDERSKRTEITADNVLKELATMGFSNIRDFAKWHGQNVRFVDSDELTESQAACISEVSQTETLHGGSFKIKLHDKKGSLELLGKHLKLFGAEQPLDINVNIEIERLSDDELIERIERVAERANALRAGIGKASDPQ